MKRFVHAMFLASLMSGSAFAQTKQWLIFSDKGPEGQSRLEHPETFLSVKALERRAKHGVPVVMADVPVSKSYMLQLSSGGIQPIGRSKWLNAVSAETSLSLAEIQKICPAVVAVQPVRSLKSTRQSSEMPSPAPLPKTSGTDWVFDYGASLDQLDLINVPCLHNKGYTGQGVLLAQFDSGFQDVDIITAFDSLRQSGHLLTYYDFVNQDSGVFDEDWHGLAVLSTIAANNPGVYVGASPHVTVALGRTETVNSETHQEEDNWLMGAEWADSMGADIIQSSLGYYEFDQGQTNYTYADMDGNTTIITKAADWAASRGILVCNSAGNEGSGAWHYIIAPCDGDSVLCVGGVDLNNSIAGFSSFGPSSDQRVKPDVVAVGTSTAVVAFGGQVMNFNGTSFSSPQIAGMVACLIQGHPQRTNMEIIEAIQQSADRYTTPDSSYGYGLPDACVADSILTALDSLAASLEDFRDFNEGLSLHPNPNHGIFSVTFPDQSYRAQAFRVLSLEGKLIREITAKSSILVHEIDLQEMPVLVHEIDLQGMPAGTYLLEIQLSGGKATGRKFVIE